MEVFVALLGAYLVAMLWGRFGVRASSRLLPALSCLVVVGAVASVTIRSHHGEQPTSWSFGLALLGLAMPALATVWLVPPGPAQAMAVTLALLSWAPLGIMGDLTVTDGGFALLVPLVLAVPLLGLLAISAVTWPGRRSHRAPEG